MANLNVDEVLKKLTITEKVELLSGRPIAPVISRRIANQPRH